MKGQTQALTTVLITTIIVGAIAAGYTWGTPLLEKQESQASLNTVERDVIRLHSSIIDVAESGQSSQREIEFVVNQGSIRINESYDFIEVRTTAETSPYPDQVWKLLRGQSMQNLSIGTGNYGIKGTDSPGVIAVRSTGSTPTSIFYRIEFRNIRADDTIERVDLQPIGNNRANGDVRVIVRNTGQQIDETYNIGGQNYRRERSVIEVDLQ